MASSWEAPPVARPVRLFVKDFPPGTSEADFWHLFEAVTGPGRVLSVQIWGHRATVRMRDEASGKRAVLELDGRPFRGHRLFVRPFRGCKIFVGYVAKECTNDELRALFEEFGPVAECDIVKDYAFVHMENEEDGAAAIEHLNGMEVKGKRICVERSKKDRRRGPTEQNDEQEAGAGKNKIPAPPYRHQPSDSFEVDYRSQPKARQAATAYRNEVHSETNSSGRSFSARSHSYERQPPDGPAAYRAAGYGMHDDTAPSYAPHLSDSLSAHDRASVEATRAVRESASVPLPSSYRARSSQQAVSTTARHSPYERVRLSPPRSSREDLYRELNAINKKYTSKQAADTFRSPYEYVRLSPPRGSRKNFDREVNTVDKSYAGRPDSAPLRRPYERVRLSPPRSSHESLRATAGSKRYYSDFR